MDPTHARQSFKLCILTRTLHSVYFHLFSYSPPKQTLVIAYLRQLPPSLSLYTFTPKHSTFPYLLTMEFKQLSNPNPNPDPVYYPDLLEPQPHSLNHNKNYHQPQSSHPKRHKTNHHLNPNAKPYHPITNPNPLHNHPFPNFYPTGYNVGTPPAPAFPYYPNQKPHKHNYPNPSAPTLTYQRRKNNLSQMVPRLVNLSNVGKLGKMMKAVQPGMMAYVPKQCPAFNILMHSKWGNIVFYRGQSYHPHLMGEFYANMVTKKDDNGIFDISSVVNNREIHVNFHVMCRALQLSPELFPQTCSNIYELFKFNQAEFEKFISFFCGDVVPIGLSVADYGIPFKHFLPEYQQLAMISRANILPKPDVLKSNDFDCKRTISF